MIDKFIDKFPADAPSFASRQGNLSFLEGPIGPARSPLAPILSGYDLICGGITAVACWLSLNLFNKSRPTSNFTNNS